VVQEERKLRTSAGHFLVGSSQISITLPNVLFEAGSTTVFPEIGAALPEDLYLAAGTGKVKVADGAALILKPRTGARLIFTLSDSGGQTMCTWQPSVKVVAHSPPQVEDGFRMFVCCGGRVMPGVSGPSFHNAGNPIVLEVGGRLARGSSEFRIDGMAAAVLAQTAWQVVLRDPRPAAGLRVVESEGYRVTLAFIELRLELPQPRRGKGILSVRLVGFDLITPPAELFLYNLSRQNVRLVSGKSFHDSPDYDEARLIRLAPQGSGVFTGECKIEFRGEGPIDLDGSLELPRPQHVFLPLVPRRR
jgi:hypothetical protein